MTLNPKNNNPSSFSDFRPIAMCNICYNLITKLLVDRIKPFMTRLISEEQLGFIKGQRILDAIGSAQEVLHNIKQKKLQALILKNLSIVSTGTILGWFYYNLFSSFLSQIGSWGVCLVRLLSSWLMEKPHPSFQLK